jgi:DNA repair protein RadD
MATAFAPEAFGNGLFAGGFTSRPLRPHQVKAKTMLVESIRKGNRRIVLQMPTGAGKTRTAAEIITGALAKGNTVAFTVPALSLIDQTVEAFESEGIDAIGVMQANHHRTDGRQPVQVCSVQTLGRRERPNADVVIVDEAHVQYDSVKNWIKDSREDAPRRTFIGLTATPWARGMADHWDDLLVPVRMGELIDAGFLSPFDVYTPSHPDMSGVKTTAGEFASAGSSEVMQDRKLVADIVQTWKLRADGLPTLVFAVDKAHAAKLVNEFAAAGIAMGYCDDHVDSIERRVLFSQMQRGELAGIVNIGTLTTGVDADVRCVVLARPTKSEMLFVQMIGRALRTAPGKDRAIILDHADNHARLGMVTDIHHPKLLGGKAAKSMSRKELGEPMPKECTACGCLKAPKVHECPLCGFKPERQSDIEVEDGELVKLTSDIGLPKKGKIDRNDKQKLWSEILGLQQQLRRSAGWASHCYRDLTKVWPRGLVDQPIEPSPEVRAWVRGKDIRFAKSRGAAR